MIGRFAADASVSAFAFLRYRKWFGSFGEGERSIMASRMLVALSSAFFLLFAGSEMAMADNDRAIVREQLKHLQSATSLVLMFVPHGMRFIVRLEERQLPDVSCVYRIDSIPGPTFDDVLRILNESILEYQEPIPSPPGNQVGIRELEPRFRLFFRFANRPPQAFYFQDWEGREKVKGYSGKYRILASADFPNRLRALVTRPDVVLIKGINNLCPHS
jgi:hypothetical protein